MFPVNLGLYRNVPKYLDALNLRTAVVDFDWDVESPFSLIPSEDAALAKDLSKMTSRAASAFSIACAEWIVFGLPVDEGRGSLILDYLEGFWAYAMGRESMFVFPPELDHEDWAVRHLSPLDCAVSAIMNVIYLSQDDGVPPNDAARMPQLVAHIYDSRIRDEFIRWQHLVVDRLSLFCLSSRGSGILGRPVPRVLFDPAQDVDVSLVDVMIEQEFYGADFSFNQFFGMNDLED